jgi:hypothetical protein
MASNYQLQTYIVAPGPDPQGPYLVAPNFSPQVPLTPLLIGVVNVAGPGASPSSCAMATGGDNVDFSLQWVTLPASQIVYAQITVSAAHVYSDSPADRQTLLTSFRAFCTSLQEMELSSKTQCLIAGGAAVIANQIAGALPLRVDEVLPYYFGFTPSSNYVDLQPGMQLRVQTGSYQFVSASSALNAFTAQSQVCYRVCRNSNQQLYLDPFLNALPVSISPTSPPQIGNLLDLTALGSRRYYRLIYPSPMNNPITVYTQPGISQNVTLLGADTPTDLANATNTYLSSKTCAAAAPGNRPILCAYFTGRTTVVPEIPVSYLGQMIYVPIGTTIQNMLDTFNVLQPDQVATSLSSFRFFRNAAAALVVPSGNTQSYSQQSILFSSPTVSVPIPSSAASLTQWDLPLVKGDSVLWTWQ